MTPLFWTISISAMAALLLGSWAGMVICYFRETRRLRRELAIAILERAMR